VCGGVPRGVAGDVGRGRPHGGLHGGGGGGGGGGAPDGSHGGGAAGKSSAIGQHTGVDLTTALLHQFLEFGSLVLEPDLHLRKITNIDEYYMNIISFQCEKPS